MSAFSKVKTTLKGNKKTAIASGIGLALVLVLMLVPIAVVPVRANETYYVTELQSAPVTETAIEKEAYVESAPREQVVFQDYMVPVQWGQYVAVPFPYTLNLGDKSTPLVSGNFLSLDQMGVHFLVLDQYNFMLFQKPFFPVPIFETRASAGSFSFVPTGVQYYIVFDNLGYNSIRYFRLNATLSWKENVTKYRDVPVTRNTTKLVPVQAARQREIIKYQRMSLLGLLIGR